MAPRAVHQLLPALHAADAIGNEALVLQSHLREAGFASEIYAAWVDPGMRAKAHPLGECQAAATADTVLLYHFGCATPATAMALQAAARLVLVYHNITPAHFFEPFSPAVARELRQGRVELASLAGRARLALAKSSFSRAELDALGFERTGVLPYVLSPALYVGAPSPVVRRLFPPDRTNILVVGRVAPNKAIEDVLGAFAVYQRHFARRSRLLLVGETHGQEAYLHSLLHLTKRLGLREVVFAGHVTQAELLGYYDVADVLLSLSDHEGYGVPLVEGMRFGVPVVAFDAGAVAETLGDAGILLKKKSPELVATVLDAVVRNSALRAGLRARQQRVAEGLFGVDAGARLLETLRPLLL